MVQSKATGKENGAIANGVVPRETKISKGEWEWGSAKFWLFECIPSVIYEDLKKDNEVYEILKIWALS